MLKGQVKSFNCYDDKSSSKEFCEYINKSSSKKTCNNSKTIEKCTFNSYDFINPRFNCLWKVSANCTITLPIVPTENSTEYIQTKHNVKIHDTCYCKIRNRKILNSTTCFCIYPEEVSHTLISENLKKEKEQNESEICKPIIVRRNCELTFPKYKKPAFLFNKSNKFQCITASTDWFFNNPITSLCSKKNTTRQAMLSRFLIEKRRKKKYFMNNQSKSSSVLDDFSTNLENERNQLLKQNKTEISLFPMISLNEPKYNLNRTDTYRTKFLKKKLTIRNRKNQYGIDKTSMNTNTDTQYFFTDPNVTVWSSSTTKIDQVPSLINRTIYNAKTTQFLLKRFLKRKKRSKDGNVEAVRYKDSHVVPMEPLKNPLLLPALNVVNVTMIPMLALQYNLDEYSVTTPKPELSCMTKFIIGIIVTIIDGLLTALVAYLIKQYKDKNKKSN